MGLDGRVVIVTGAGRGLGREHALLLASLGARVVANDRGASVAGLGSDPAPAERVVEEIRSRGGSALASTHDVADWADARRLVSCAVETYGRLDGLVNNAGILRDRRIWEMEESEFDDVVRTDLKGHVAPTRWASDYWRDRAIADGPQDAAVVHTSSHSGLLGVAGQSNYGAAKAGVAAFGLIVADELSEFGVRSNVIVPGARTRMGAAFRARDPERPDPSTLAPVPTDPEAFDAWDPAHVSPLVAHLVDPECDLHGQVLLVAGRTLRRVTTWGLGPPLVGEDRWTVAGLAEGLRDLVPASDRVRRVPPSPF
ncbi:MAG: SDR family NAD(P)-dependent oxidoreductase [Actinomycetes bacterium]|jgi:short-subunit dehydrogenase